MGRAVGADPLGQIERIYDWLGLHLESGTRKAMEAWLVENAREKRAPHEDSLETFGLARADIEREFADYRARFDIGSASPN